jgi:formylglycine-generating enzyme
MGSKIERLYPSQSHPYQWRSSGFLPCAGGRGREAYSVVLFSGSTDVDLLMRQHGGLAGLTHGPKQKKTMQKSHLVAALWAAFALTSSLQAQPLVNIETVTVGDAGNAADATGYGAVGYEFNIAKYEVTIGQYTTFLNAVAATDTYSLYNPNMATNLNMAGITQAGSSGSFSYSALGSGNRPISYVSWFDGARFANWMNNGATNGASTETGAYTLNGATTGIITKNPGADWWIPSEDEWYKAAYSMGGGTNAGYWDYPTQSDSTPGNLIGGATNQANYNNGVYSVTQSNTLDSTLNYLTAAGTFSNSASAYNTFDQGGNVSEWNDAVIGSSRGVRGSAWFYLEDFLQSSSRGSNAPTNASSHVGFRVASVPEPSTYALILMAGAGWLLWRRRKINL